MSTHIGAIASKLYPASRIKRHRTTIAEASERKLIAGLVGMISDGEP